MINLRSFAVRCRSLWLLPSTRKRTWQSHVHEKFMNERNSKCFFLSNCVMLFVFALRKSSQKPTESSAKRDLRKLFFPLSLASESVFAGCFPFHVLEKAHCAENAADFFLQPLTSSSST